MSVLCGKWRRPDFRPNREEHADMSATLLLIEGSSIFGAVYMVLAGWMHLLFRDWSLVRIASEQAFGFSIFGAVYMVLAGWMHLLFRDWSLVRIASEQAF